MFEKGEINIYFLDTLNQLLSNKQIEISEFSKNYILELLKEMLRNSNQFTLYENNTIVEIISHLNNMYGKQKADGWRRLGEYVLVNSSFFEENLDRKKINKSYFTQWGKFAYNNSSQIYSIVGEKIWSEICEEINIQFYDLICILEEIIKLDDSSSQNGLLKLLDRWHKTRKLWMRKRLIEKGLLTINENNIVKNKN